MTVSLLKLTHLDQSKMALEINGSKRMTTRYLKITELDN